ncbi:morphogenetic protein [Salmonella enterica subsp. enterica serovar Ohio]|uniref:Morphogenetic protein n=1 Tax=Salmonella enterica subsp. enterica serovar Mbandaka TaxID=192954 RepID=A0A6Y5B2V1_SALET|nr:morphogenetic protein [Salmonella enterica]EBR8885000.1 morphogenetic protein [Salmonella enterica subsp. enterica serovar Galiema]EBS6179189.1 morphogenetic protein [Salmonella enterica subsp. enterica serovar Braenderup]ECQ7735043.1 morphogenetic protein [Salmonella enterica subsp. enterica serovar Brunei]EDQ7168487.1 morphogenetic protein [Salmonella enterica subsp. enterica]EDU9510537.1 morphogenetic protein [Salmonella enterica subsp. enterica serovar Ohio]MBJ3042999.1 morphogenetic p
MKERGMIFNGEMVRAILDGRKTQTRRIMKVQPDEDGLAKVIDGPFVDTSGRIYRCPFGVPGDRIWVRETFQGPLFDYEQMEAYLEDSSKFEKPEFCQYAADGKPAPEYYDADDNLRHGWRPSIHMPRWASRILLEITDVRVERLNNISECDAKSEGGPTECTLIGDKYFPGFRSLWKSIYGEESWAANPWVWVIEFKRIEGGAA